MVTNSVTVNGLCHAAYSQALQIQNITIFDIVKELNLVRKISFDLHR